MGYTLDRLRRRTLRHLRLRMDQAAVEDQDLVEAVETGRREVWRRCDGAALSPETRPIDLVAGQASYSLPGLASVASASVVDSESGPRRNLRPLPARHLAALYPEYPEIRGDRGAPVAYMLRASGLVGSVPDEEGFGFSSPSSPVLTVWPAPSASVDRGLWVQAGSGPSPLPVEPGDGTESILPRIVDETACLMAALELSAFLSDDARTAANVPMLREMLKEGLDACRETALDLDDSEWSIYPGDNFGASTPPAFIAPVAAAPVPEPGPPVLAKASRRQVSASAVSASGAERVTIALPSTAPVASDGIGAVLVLSDEQGYISRYSVAEDRLSIVARTRDGAQFFGETVTAYYETVGV